MNDLEFTSVLELKAHIKPVLDCRVKELTRKNIKYVSQDDIFEYLRINVWPTKTNLTLYNIVDDVLNVDDKLLCDYVISKLNKNNK